MANNVLKTIFGLFTAILVMTAMVVPATSMVDPQNAKFKNTIINVVDEDNATLTFTVFTVENGLQTANLYLVNNAPVVPVEQKLNDDVYTIQSKNGYQNLEIDWTDFVDAANDLGLNLPVIGTPEQYDFVLRNAVGNAPIMTDDAWINVVSATPESNIATEMFDLDQVVDQTGKKDELNPGDAFTAYIDIDADKDAKIANEPRVYHGMSLKGTLYKNIGDTTDPALAVAGEYYGYDETKTFTLGDETEVTKTLKFEIPRQIALDNDNEKGYLMLVVDVNAYEQTVNPEAHGNSQLVYLLDVEANEDSLYISEVAISDNEVSAGQSISVEAEVCNDGVETQNNIKVTTELVGLVSYNGMIIELANDDCKAWSTGIAVPVNAKAGTYDLKVTAISEEGAKAEYTKQITVEGSTVVKETTLVADEAEQDVSGKTTYTLTLKNDGADRKTYDIEVEGAEWAKVDAPATVTVQAGEEKTVEITVTPKSGETGELEFTVYAKVDGNVEAYESLTANVASSSILKDDVVKVLQWVFAVIIIVAIILVIVWAVTKGRNAEGDKKDVYY